MDSVKSLTLNEMTCADSGPDVLLPSAPNNKVAARVWVSDDPNDGPTEAEKIFEDLQSVEMKLHGGG